MIRDVATVVWKEIRELVQLEPHNRRGLYRIGMIVLILGVLYPLQMGPAFVRSWAGGAFVAFAATFQVAGLVPDTFAGERERHTLETLLATRLPDLAILLGKTVAVTLYGIGVGFAILPTALIVVNLSHRDAGLVLYSPRALAAAIAFSILGAGFTAAAGVLISLRATTVKQAQQVLTTAVIAVLFLPVLGVGLLPPAWRLAGAAWVAGVGRNRLLELAAAALLVIDLLLFAAAAARFRRARLILE